MKKIYIHIGIGKTGTSSIQQFLSQNYDIFKKELILYPQTGRSENVHSLISPLFPIENDLNDLFFLHKKLKNEISISESSVIIISSEYLSFTPIEQILNLKKTFSGYECYIIFYVRNSNDFFKSVYLQSQKIGQSLGLCVSQFYRHSHEHLDFNKVIAPWEEVFGQSAIKASLYHPEIVGDDVRRHFLGQVGITDPELISKLNFDQERENPSIHPLLSDLVTVIDQNESLNNRSEIIEEILNISEHIKGIKCSLFTPEQEVEIRDYYAESNAAFADKYLTPREKELLLGAESTKVTSGKKNDSGIIYKKDVLSKILNNQLNKLTQEHDKLTKEFEALTQEKDALTDQLDIHAQEKNMLTQNLNSFAHENESLHTQLALALNMNQELRNSTSWKITSPIRYVKRKILGGVRNTKC